VSVARSTASVPVSPTMFRVVEIAAEFAMAIIRPFAATVTTGTVEVPPYVPADKPETVDSDAFSVALAVPLYNCAVATTSPPEILIYLSVWNCVAEFALPSIVALIVVAVMVPNAALPFASRRTSVPPVFKLVAAST